MTTTATMATTTTTAAAETTARPAPEREPSRPESASPTRSVRAGIDRLRWLPSSLRARIVAWFVGVLALATIGFLLVTYEVLQIRLDQRIDADLRQERPSCGSSHSGGTTRGPGRRFASVDRIFDVYLARNVASKNEVLITFLGGEPYYKSPQPVPYALDTRPRDRPALGERSPQTDRGAVDTPAGRVEYLAVPIKVEDETGGVFVAAVFRDRATGRRERGDHRRRGASRSESSCSARCSRGGSPTGSSGRSLCSTPPRARSRRRT